MLLLLLLRASHRASGQSSVERKKGLIGKLIVASKGSEPGYIIRSLQASGAFAWTAGWLALQLACTLLFPVLWPVPFKTFPPNLVIVLLECMHLTRSPQAQALCIWCLL
jgi:hypothetical protein